MTFDEYSLVVYCAGAVGLAIAMTVGLVQDWRKIWGSWSEEPEVSPGIIAAASCLVVAFLSAVWPLTITLKGISKLTRRAS